MATGSYLGQTLRRQREESTKRRCTTTTFFASLALSLLAIGALALFIVQAVGSGKPTSNGGDLSAQAMDTTEAYYNVSTIIPLYVVDVVCSSDSSIASDDNLKATIVRSNAIYVRSKTDFKFDLAVQRRALPLDSCSIFLDDNVRIAYIMQLGSALFPEFNPNVTNILVFSVSIAGNTAHYRTKGFSNVGTKTVFIDKAEFASPTSTLAHEIGHSL